MWSPSNFSFWVECLDRRHDFSCFPLGLFPFWSEGGAVPFWGVVIVLTFIYVLVINHICYMLCPVGPWFGNNFYSILYHNSLISCLFFLIEVYYIVNLQWLLKKKYGNKRNQSVRAEYWQRHTSKPCCNILYSVIKDEFSRSTDLLGGNRKQHSR